MAGASFLSCSGPSASKRRLPLGGGSVPHVTRPVPPTTFICKVLFLLALQRVPPFARYIKGGEGPFRKAKTQNFAYKSSRRDSAAVTQSGILFFWGSVPHVTRPCPAYYFYMQSFVFLPFERVPPFARYIKGSPERLQTQQNDVRTTVAFVENYIKQ
jgi:hypothetical protein